MSRFAQAVRRLTKRPRLLPAEAYPAGISEETKDRIDAHLRWHRFSVPRRVGRWYDRTGDVWTLDADGGWTDHTGVWHGREYAPLMAFTGPFKKAPPRG